ncbi:MAG: hypothetical protein ACPIFP_00950, partial [Candidatus Poseidoniaceae archaeon]
VWTRRDQLPAPRLRLRMRSGPTQERDGDTCCPTWLGSGQNFPDLHLEQFSFDGTSTALRRRPYFRRGMAWIGWKGAK